MPLPFLRRRRRKAAPVSPPRPTITADSFTVHEHRLRLQLQARSGDGVRLIGQPSVDELPGLLAGVARSKVELVLPLSPDAQSATPDITRPADALLWINTHHQHDPITRHALYVFESTDAIDTAYETAALALLQGDLDADGRPRFDAIVGGLISFWDENTGELVVRAAVGWGGDGTRSDTDRTARRLLARMMTNILDSQGAQGLHAVERPVGHGGTAACMNCGFDTLSPQARYCPKCGVRRLR
ncbi:MAG TPA: hypothetical protein VH741_03535 [Candidatus Limnocylindrales bacterium]|jgi:hypothetical protein